MLFAERDGYALALACSAPWANHSVGFVGVSDGWQDLSAHKRMEWNYARAEIAALLAAAGIADESGEPGVATYLRETADYWNANIERWIYVMDTEIDRALGVEGHYVRVAPPEKADAASPRNGFVPIKGRPPDQCVGPASCIPGPDALALARFGLRAADDPRVTNTVKVIDALLKVETPNGPAWRRYVDDKYVEHEDGSAFDGAGIGRAWPLLTGERAHYELAAKRLREAEALMRAMEGFANDGRMIPEQVWDAPDIPERELLFGRASGSAMPLVWAHAEYVKLSRSLDEGRVFDLPPQTVNRYLANHTGSPCGALRKRARNFVAGTRTRTARRCDQHVTPR